MRKIFIFIVILVFVGITGKCASNDIRVLINGIAISFDTTPVEMNGEVLAPLRAIAEGLGWSVSWDGDTQTIYMANGNDILLMQVNNTTCFYNSTEYVLSVPPQIVDGRTLVPCIFTANIMGFDTTYNSTTKILYINDNLLVNSNVPSGKYSGEIEVILSVVGEGYDIYYTVDDSDPRINGNKYIAPIKISKTINLKTVSLKNGEYSDVKIYSYEIVHTYSVNSITFTDLNGNPLTGLKRGSLVLVNASLTMNDSSETHAMLIVTLSPAIIQYMDI